MKIRSIVGLLPLIASGVLLQKNIETLLGFDKRTRWFLENRLDLAQEIIFLHHQEKCPINSEPSLFLSIPKKKRIERLLDTIFDESEFLSNYGIRSMSKIHEEFPFSENGYCCAYLPGESTSKMFGGNSNWRGPIWMPINFLLIESLEKLDSFYASTLKVEVPKDSGNFIKCGKAATEICERITHLFLPLPGKCYPNRPIHGEDEFFLREENKELIYFYEHFHGCSGRGLGATHQTGWTALVTNCLFKIAASRDRFTSEMGPKTKEFVDANLKAFIPSTWCEDVKCISQCHALGSNFLKLGYENIGSMMEDLFAQCPWRYLSLLHKYARSLHLDRQY